MAIHTSCGFDVFWFVVGFSDLVEYCTIHFIFRVRARTMGCSPRNLDRYPRAVDCQTPIWRIVYPRPARYIFLFFATSDEKNSHITFEILSFCF